MWWSVFALVVTSQYSTSLVSHLTYPNFEPMKSTVEDLVKNGYYWGTPYEILMSTVFNLDVCITFLWDRGKGPNKTKWSNINVMIWNYQEWPQKQHINPPTSPLVLLSLGDVLLNVRRRTLLFERTFIDRWENLQMQLGSGLEPPEKGSTKGGIITLYQRPYLITSNHKSVRPVFLSFLWLFPRIIIMF